MAAGEIVVWRPPLLELTLLDDHEQVLDPMISALLLACHVLRLSQETTFTAGCLLHRYFATRRTSTQQANQPPKESTESEAMKALRDKDLATRENGGTATPAKPNDRLILVCCILLACKAEEEPRRLRDFINLSQMLYWQREGETAFSSGKPHVLFWQQDPPPLDEGYWSIKDQIVKTEQHVLRWLAFDVFVSHAHRAVVALVRQEEERQHSSLQQLAKRAFHLLNRVSLYSPQALSVPVIPLAAAVLQLAAQEELGQAVLLLFESDATTKSLVDKAFGCLTATVARLPSSSVNAESAC